ncbi:MAG: hypothetical protein GY822_31700, partial [Deltaproteobacteria bacterium]|nr:hypothetical protein [Deltaproteobacteria bacterium]
GENATIKRSPAQIFYVELLEPEVLDDINEFSDRYDATNPPPKLRLHPYGGFTGPTISVPDAGVTTTDGTVVATELEIHKFHASEVNPLTKACNFDKDDLNYDGIADVLQSHDTAIFDIGNASGTGVVTHSIAAVSFVATEFFYRMSYYTELDVGFFRPFLGECGAIGGSCRGEYIIAERSRVLGPAAMNGIFFEYPSNVDNYWQTCMRGRDPNYPGDDETNLGVNHDFGAWYDFCVSETAACRYTDGTSERIPFDGRSFADFSDGSLPREGVIHGLASDRLEGVDGGVGDLIFPGMNHHSQFKCIATSTLTGTNQGNRALPDPAVGDVFAQDCRLEPHSQNDGIEGDANPSIPGLLCTNPGSIEYQIDGFNYWMAMGQQTYSADGPIGYEGGCIDEGREWGAAGAAGDDPFLCKVQRENQAAANFGQLFCGCGTNRSGVECEIGCPDQSLYSDREAVNGELVGYWMCARPSTTEGVTLRSEPVADGGVHSGYVLRGAIPAVAMPTEVLNDGQVNDAGVATGYTLRPYPIY